MTIDQFNQRHGKDYDVFKSTPMFRDLIAVAEAEGPHNRFHKIDFKTMTDSPQAALGTISGYALFRDLLLKLGTTSVQEEEKSDFAGMTLEEQIAQEDFAESIRGRAQQKPKKGRKK